MEEESKDFSISTDDPTPTYFVDGRWVIIPLRICRNSDDYRSDHNWSFSIQVNSVTSVDGRSLDNLPKMYLRYRKHPNDDNPDIRGNEDAIYFFRYEARTKEYHTLVRVRGIYDLVFEFEDTDELNRIPRTIDLHIKVELWWV